MRYVAQTIVLAAAVALSACTTLEPVKASPEEVQRMLISDELVKPGKRVRLVTADEVVYEFRVTEVDREQGFIVGEHQRVPISRIVAVDTREVSVGRTSLLAGGVGIGVAALVAIALAPAIILGGG